MDNSRLIYPDKENAKNSIAHYREINGSLNKKSEKVLSIISSHSRFLGNYLVHYPTILSYLSNLKTVEKKKAFSNYLRAVLTIVKNSDSVEAVDKKLRHFKYRELSRIIYREVLGVDNFIHIMEEISDLASALVNGVLEFHMRELEGKEKLNFVILGMGKLGGRLLNLSSDIDLIYLYDGEITGNNVFDLCKNVTKSINSITEDRFLYRVDMGLRPGGGKSPLAVHIDGAIEHYYYWGETWERAVFIQARPIAGDIDFGNRFLKEIYPFVYKSFLDYTSIEDLKDMKLKIDKLHKKRDVKLGVGGIRDLEFFVQALQLVNGGEFPELHRLNSLEGLKKLNKLGLITKEVKDELTDCYLFLRKVEHSIQLYEELQTHKIPSDKSSLLRLSKRMGFKSIEKFEAEYKRVVGIVSKNYSNLFHSSTKIVEDKGNEFWELADFLTGGDITEEESLENLKKLGFNFPDRVLDIISSLVDPERGGLDEKGRAIRRKIVPAFLSEIIKSYNPDSALINLDRFISGIGFRTSIYSILRENPEIIKLLSRLFSRSGMLSSFLIKHPEYLDTIILKGVTFQYEDLDQMVKVLSDSVDAEDNFEDKLNALRRFKNVESLKLCFRELNEEVDPIYVGDYLSKIAKAVMEVGLSMAVREMKLNKKQRAEINKIVIIGMGKLGGGEMSYNSDLDIIFIYEGEDHELFSKLGQRFISNLSVPTSDGYCYKIDLELRPSGNAGVLVSSFSSFVDYHKNSAQLWERQALIKADVVAGDKQLGKKVIRIIKDFVYKKPLDKQFRQEIYNLRARIESELAKESKTKVNLKMGKGGLIDIEFLAQMLQLKFGGKYKELRSTNTINSLIKLNGLDMLADKDFNILYDGYLFFKKLENLLRLLNDRSIDDIKEGDFDRLAVESGSEYDVVSLRKKYDTVTDQVRDTYNKYFLSEKLN